MCNNVKPHRETARLVQRLAFVLPLLFLLPSPLSLAQTITPSGLNTAVSGPIAFPNGQTQIDITGGTRPGGGGNVFHSFGNFSVPNNTTANFLNKSGLPTSNILARVTGGNTSNILGTIQTTGFGNANLFLMNPAGFLFGPNATLNVGGMVAFTSADYLRLADGGRFTVNANAGLADILTAAPVAAFGFLGANPGAISLQGSQLVVAEGTGISLVGGRYHRPRSHTHCSEWSDQPGRRQAGIEPECPRRSPRKWIGTGGDAHSDRIRDFRNHQPLSRQHH